jgi:hypothetical protein
VSGEEKPCEAGFDPHSDQISFASSLHVLRVRRIPRSIPAQILSRYLFFQCDSSSCSSLGLRLRRAWSDTVISADKCVRRSKIVHFEWTYLQYQSETVSVTHCFDMVLWTPGAKTSCGVRNQRPTVVRTLVVDSI